MDNSPKEDGVKETTQLENNREVEAINDAIIAEYSFLRGEISLYHSHQKQIMNFVFILFVALIGFLGSDVLISNKFIVSFQVITLSAPYFFLLLSLLYADRTVRIIRIADYIHNHLRNKAIENLNFEVWDWENYKRTTKIFNRRLTLFLDKMRWLVFIIPGIMSLLIYLQYSQNSFSTFGSGIKFCLSTLAIFLSLFVMFVTEETKGIKSKNINDIK